MCSPPTTRTASTRRCCGRAGWTCTSTWAIAAGEAFKTLARNYFLVDNHTLFPEIQELLSAVDVTPAEVSEMLLRSEDVDVALQPLVEFPQKKRQRAWNETENKKAADDREDVSEKAV